MLKKVCFFFAYTLNLYFYASPMEHERPDTPRREFNAAASGRPLLLLTVGLAPSDEEGSNDEDSSSLSESQANLYHQAVEGRIQPDAPRHDLYATSNGRTLSTLGVTVSESDDEDA